MVYWFTRIFWSRWAQCAFWRKVLLFFRWRTLVPSARPLFSSLCVCICPTKSVCCIFQLWKIQSTEFGLCWRKNGQLNLLVHYLPFWDMNEIVHHRYNGLTSTICNCRGHNLLVLIWCRLDIPNRVVCNIYRRLQKTPVWNIHLLSFLFHTNLFPGKLRLVSFGSWS